MAPAPSPNACGLAAYRQLAGNLNVTHIDHPYWTSRKANADRFALWHERRRHAAGFLQRIAPLFETEKASLLQKAAEAFRTETSHLKSISKSLPPGGPEKAHWEKANIQKVADLLNEARTMHETGMRALVEVVGKGFVPVQSSDPKILEKLVADENGLVAESALAALVKLGPDDLDVRLARLFKSEKDARKIMCDGPIHRQLLFALEKLHTPAATQAVGEAMLFPGKSDDVSQAVSRWAAEIYWKRVGKDGKELFLKALDSEVPHVQEQGLTYLGRIGDSAMLQRINKFKRPAAYAARIRMGDEEAYAPLIEALGTPNWYEAYSGLRDLGTQVEPRLLPHLKSDQASLARNVALLLSRVGTKASWEALKEYSEQHRKDQRIQQALADLGNRMEKHSRNE